MTAQRVWQLLQIAVTGGGGSQPPEPRHIALLSQADDFQIIEMAKDVPREFGDLTIAGKSADRDPHFAVLLWHTDDLNGHRLLLRVNPDIARALKEEESAVVRDLKQSIGKDVTIKPDVQLHHEQFDVMAV